MWLGALVPQIPNVSGTSKFGRILVRGHLNVEDCEVATKFGWCCVGKGVMLALCGFPDIPESVMLSFSPLGGGCCDSGYRSAVMVGYK